MRSSVPNIVTEFQNSKSDDGRLSTVMQNAPKAQLANDLDRALQSTGANRRRSGGSPQ
jgi:hypothetical protein